ncbi:unnamed protein product [Periconia digitata]|uniref:Protein transport protein sec16 n=1 Tax=Periconia digitata TaxID=1303443 RepID=A0A9W4U7S9_9PLEO|nr:unnamed protein product [Periconia digitata]
MEDGAPNFSYAYADTLSPSEPSWNPALRPDHAEADQNKPLQFQPSPQIIPQSKPELDQGLEDDDELPTISAPVAPAASASNDDTPERAPVADDDFVEHLASAAAATHASPEYPVGTMNGHDEDTTVQQESEDSGESDSPGSPEAPLAENYESQAETSLLEDAVAESAKVPLLDSTQSAADEWDSGEVFDLGGVPQDAPVRTATDIIPDPLQTPQAEAVGTTVGDDVIGNTKVGGNTGEELDWGNTAEDDFFGAVAASQPVQAESPASEGPGAHIVDKSASADTDPLWDLDMDDDFLPDTAEAPIIDLDDDEGFLEDESAPAAPQPIQSTASRYAPQPTQAPQSPANPYGVQGSQFSNFTQIDQPKSAAPATPYGAYAQPSPYQQQVPRPSMPSSSESFAAKAKGGYHSPYDLPDDVVTTRKRPAARTTSIPQSQPAPPPPRSSSMSGSGASRPPPLPPTMPASSLSPPSSGHSTHSQMTGMPPPNAGPKSASLARSPSSDFFADLPVTSKPKPSPRYTPQPSPQLSPTHGFPSKERTASWSSLRNEFRPDSDNLISQLQQPEQLPVFPDQPSAPVRTNSLPVPQAATAPPSNRYSPAPPAASAAPAANARYSPAPPSGPAPPPASSRYSPAPPPPSASAPPNTLPRPPIQPYAPRTSSPLAFHTSPQHQGQEQQATAQEQHASHAAPPLHALHSAEGVPRVPYKTPLEGVSESEEQAQTSTPVPPPPPRSETPPQRSRPSSAVSSPRKRSNYAPQYQPVQPNAGGSVVSPPRTQSQSPTTTMKQPNRSASYDRPASSHNFMPQPSTFGAAMAVPSSAQNLNTIPPRTQVAPDYEPIVPTDERASDPLLRWKGAPVFTWGLGGTVVTTFPKQIPRYGGGATMPMMKCSPGEVKIQTIKEILPLSPEISKFPGPLKAKGKKKEVSGWLSAQIEELENQFRTPSLSQFSNETDQKRFGEKILLWKVLQVLVDHDGHLHGNEAAEAAVRKVLSPEADKSTEGEASFATAADLVGITRSNTGQAQAEPANSRSLEELRNHLTKGDREKAVWHAVDQRLWAHAMILSSTLSKDTWKQVVQEFVREEVKKVDRDNQPLAVLYQIFAGNHEECIDQLVPASARAGFQMVSTDGANTQNALQGLDKWQESLSLILNNRSEGDVAALLSLGRLLAGYGRVEAGHICFIFARVVCVISGVDDPQSDIVLIGADHRQNPLDLGVDLEPVLLTEVYEFGLSLSAQGNTHIIPHLQNFKLAHAYRLAEHGLRTEARAYCDAIAAAMKATPKVSPYYNASFITSLDDLSNRLSQSPQDGSSSLFSKPNMDKVSSSLLSKFNSFIAGDDENRAAGQTPGDEAGPFAKIAGDTPTMSPVQSSADLYGAYSGYGVSSPPAASSNSRYAPSNASNAYAPRSSMESTRGRYEPGGRPSLDSLEGSGNARTVSESHVISPGLASPYAPMQAQLSPGHPTLTKAASYSPLRSEHTISQPSYGSPYQPASGSAEPSPAFGGYQPLAASTDNEPTDQAPSSSGYEPPSSYEPPTFTPYNNNNSDQEDEDDEKPKPKPKSFMDDDEEDDLVSRAANLKISSSSSSTAPANRTADAAVLAAAEADAKRDKEAAAAKKGGWFGGWFKKDPNAAPGPIKAKLGEESSFYYDPDLGKWVNKKAGAEAATAKPMTPPPPRSISGGNPPPSMGPPSSLPSGSHLSAPPRSGLPPNSRSSSMPPPMSAGPASRASTPGLPSDNEDGSALSGPKPPVLTRPSFPGASGPPSRPGTGMSTASSIDDLLGAPQARKGPSAKKKKGGRYVDVMAK